MDPNATLAMLRELISEHQADDNESVDTALDRFDSVCDLFEGLDKWIRDGGFLPSDWQAI